MENFILNFIDWIYKKKCYCCSSSNESVALCSKCYNELEFNTPQVNRIIKGCNIYVAGEYSKNLQKIIRGVKFHNKKELAFYIAKYMFEYFKSLNITTPYEVVPVPLHQTRKKKRKYNHMELVTEEFCKLSGLTPNYKLIKRVKNTLPQYKLSKQERVKNLENAFEVNKDNIVNSILIIDDICSSGATFEEMIKKLKENNVQNIICLAATSPHL